MKRRLAVLAVIIAVVATGLSLIFFNVNFIPNPASPERQSIDSLLKILFGIASIFFTIVVVVFLDSVLFFRRRKGDNTDGPPIKGHSPLEIIWTVIPLVIVLVLGTYGGIVLEKMTAMPPPQTALEIDVLTFRFGWQFTYPEYGVQSFEMGLPVNRPVILRLTSKDVIHAFWVPQFGPKQDAVPGMTTEMTFTPTQEGKYTVYCSQLCGFGHTYMLAPVSVTSPADFQQWVQKQDKVK